MEIPPLTLIGDRSYKELELEIYINSQAAEVAITEIYLVEN
ncbi:hypothetical protein [Priestia endophytica]|nr:hypothetical protein [Priestia endophytica]